MFGTLYEKLFRLRFLCTAKLLISSGKGIRPSFLAIAQMSLDRQLQSSIEEWDQQLEKGVDPSTASQSLDILGSMTRQMLVSCFESGTMDIGFTKLVEYTEAEIQEYMTTLEKILPVLFLFAAVILWIAF